MKTLYLHMGTPKTGTTATQFFLEKNQEELSKLGYWYGKMPYHYPEARMLRNGHFLVGSIYDEEGNEIDRTPRVLEGLEIIKVKFRDHDNVILSDEGMWNARKERRVKMKALLTEFCKENDVTLKIIVYLRSQGEFAESLYKQRVKEFSQKLEPWEEFKERAHKVFRLDYWGNLQKLIDWVGRENIIVRKYDRNHFYKDMVQADFLQAIGIEMDDRFTIEKDEEEKNFSLDNNYTEIKRVLNTLQEKVVLNSDESWFFRRAVTEAMNARPSDGTSLFSDEDYEQFMQRFEESNRKIAQEFFGEDEPLFMKRTRSMPKWEVEHSEFLDDVIRTFGVLTKKQNDKTVHLEGQFRRQKETIKNLTAQLKEQKTEISQLKETNKELLQEMKKAKKLEEDMASVRKLLHSLHNFKSVFKKS